MLYYLLYITGGNKVFVLKRVTPGDTFPYIFFILITYEKLAINYYLILKFNLLFCNDTLQYAINKQD